MRWSVIQTSVPYHNRFVRRSQVCGGRYSFFCMGVWCFLYVGEKRGRSLAEKEAEKKFLREYPKVCVNLQIDVR